MQQTPVKFHKGVVELPVGKLKTQWDWGWSQKRNCVFVGTVGTAVGTAGFASTEQESVWRPSETTPRAGAMHFFEPACLSPHCET